MLATYPKYSKTACKVPALLARLSSICVLYVVLVIYDFCIWIGHSINKALPAATQLVARTYHIILLDEFGVCMYLVMHGLSREELSSEPRV